MKSLPSDVSMNQFVFIRTTLKKVFEGELPPKLRTTQKQIQVEITPGMIYFPEYQ